jgi:uncharacterized protein (TIGR02118 family)
MKLIALYSHPDNPEEFDKAYFETHLPLIRKVPGLQDVVAIKPTRTLVGEKAPYLIAEMTFENKEKLVAGLNSAEMAAAGKNLDSFAMGMYTLTMAEEV